MSQPQPYAVFAILITAAIEMLTFVRQEMKRLDEDARKEADRDGTAAD